MNNLGLGLQLMGYGLAGVFTTLIAFMGLIYLLGKIFPGKKDD